MFKVKGGYTVGWYPSQSGQITGYGLSGDTVRAVMAGNGIELVDPPTDDLEVGVAYKPLTHRVVEEMRTPYKIVYSMFEADRWPDAWVDEANCANQVWVPSTFCRDSLLASGCEAPVAVVPLGIDPDLFRPAERPENEVFTIGYVGSATHRKGFDLLVKAFSEEFGVDEPVRLLIHTVNILSGHMPKHPNIKVSTEPLFSKQLADFYRSLDLFVMPTRCEGIGLTGLEALACGTPAAITDWSGCTDYLADDCLKIAIDGTRPVPGYHGTKGSQAQPSLAAIRYCMRWAYICRDEVRAMGEAASRRVRKDWTWERTARTVKRLLAKVDPTERVQTEEQVVVVWNGDPKRITTNIGGFVRGVPRILTPEQIIRLGNPPCPDFSIEKRHKRIG